MKRLATVCLVLAACAPSGKPSGRFETPFALNVVPSPSALITDVTVGEFDGDGLHDLAIAWADGSVTVSRFADSGLAAPVRVDGDHRAPLLATRFEGAFRDVLITANATNRVQRSSWSEDRLTLLTDGWAEVASAPKWFDLNSAASLTVLTAEALTVVELTPTVRTVDVVPLTLPANQFAVGDLDGDGTPDVVTDASIPNAPGWVAIGQLGDEMEVLVSGERSVTRWLWRNGRFEANGALSLSGCSQTLIVDIDADGANDVVALCNGVVEVLRNLGGSFQAVNRLPVDGARLLRRGDVTGDGLPDLIIVPGSASGTVFVARARAAP